MKTTETKHTPAPWSENKNYRDGYKSAMLTDENTKLGWENSEKSKSWKSYTDKPVSDYWRGYADGLLSKREHAALCAVAEALESIHSLASDLAGSTLTLRELFGTFQHGCGVPESEGKQSIKALANLEGIRKSSQGVS